ncbi:biosynthetic arginine decarboxylase [Aliikangiella coralliicola]|uniref:Arginine decarboxylase n=1 Tax=Aliikangiella coralliicola TaxID=2592383 RepID=A0A545UBM7_9GAMM|nr:biosynthetic arginine decarboxylase [Aliikangiella coralliicola]TQV86833.1 biosynthetic arginine decarboxylase [Aliikangiella coralliicola]
MHSVFNHQLDQQQWSVDQAIQHYNVKYWGENYFDLNNAGELLVRPDPNQTEATFELTKICQSLAKKGMQMPVLLRFIDILRHRVESLCDVFNNAISEQNYQGNYTVCYPIKVNQQRRVVEGLIKSNQKLAQPQVGLEAGSKSELMAVLALSEKTNSVIVCNGYKDRDYLRTALIATQLGHQVYIVIEKISELDLLLQEAEIMDVTPRIGIRARLASKGESKWQESGGEHSKFGLSASQILRVVDKLKKENQLNIFQLLHFHLGSQITSIRDIQNALKECARFYAELCKIGAPITTVDVGGGLGVDYEGTQSQSHCSVNYSLSEYANNVVGAFRETAEKSSLPHPSIITESGRALTAHHAVLITNVIDSEKPREVEVEQPFDDCHVIIHNLWDIFIEAQDSENNHQLIECYHNAEYLLKQTQEMFNHGIINLVERGLAERTHRRILFTIKQRIDPEIKTHHETLAILQQKLASKFFVNFSVFQSLPDAWAIDQIFPIMPLKGLHEKPQETAILQDITCDSDGVLKHYVNGKSIMPTVDLPHYTPDEEYLIGLFMVGAYQEILGDMHNLFGDTHTVDLELNGDNELKVVATETGSSVEELLDYVDFDAKSLLESYRRQLKQSALPQSTQRQYLAELRQGIYGYCYLEE